MQEGLGPDRVSALMTTTEASLDRAHEIIDTYADLGLRNVFLRPISPYGFALRRARRAGYDVARWLEFYEAGLDYIIDLNRRGLPDGGELRGDRRQEDVHATTTRAMST